MKAASSSPMFVLLSYYGYPPSPISGNARDTLWIHPISEDMRHPGGGGSAAK